MDVEEYKPITTYKLAEAIREFCNHNRHSRSVNDRWLADYLLPVHETVCAVGNSKLRDADIKSVKAFRTAELERQIEEKRREAEKLERDLKQVQAEV